ncbi:unnamed protein product [Linum tenue]|uniref:TF-B3 domain-containing protein n=1 Tax=Linum tenue TaxID=586396 RepID=A0AAV0IWQ2_9ROSI|nr:unnamed protein product [Linum tenue]
MEAHAIGVWYLVVFEYLGDSMFRVVQIFDRTTRACLHGSGDEHSTDNNNNQQQQEAEAEKEEEQTHLINEPEGDEMEAVISTLATKGAHVIETISSKTSTASGILTSESNRLLEMNANKLQNPCFLVAIHQFDRVVTSGSEGEDELLGELWDGGRGKWKVQIYANSSGCVHLRKGWCELYRDNSLKEGDICLFELTGAKPVVLKASIFRVSPQ